MEDELDKHAIELDDVYMLDDFNSLLEHDAELLDCLLNLPESDTPEENPLNYEHIRECQQNDAKLAANIDKWPERYVDKELAPGVNVTCYIPPNSSDPDRDWKIALPEKLVQPTVEWFHLVMGHPGDKRLREALNSPMPGKS